MGHAAGFDRFIAEMDDEEYAAMVARLDAEGVPHGYEVPRQGGEAAFNSDALLAALAAGDEGSIAACDLCGRSEDHSHGYDEWGWIERDDES